jgi:hypothetical protein
MNIRSLMLWCSVCAILTLGSPAIHAQMAATKQSEIKPTRPECAVLLPQRDELDDLAKLVRADQFLRCERDGFPRQLAPPWKNSAEAHDKLVDACDYYAGMSGKYFRRVGQDALKTSHDRCITSLLTLSMTELDK